MFGLGLAKVRLELGLVRVRLVLVRTMVRLELVRTRVRLELVKVRLWLALVLGYIGPWVDRYVPRTSPSKHVLSIEQKRQT